MNASQQLLSGLRSSVLMPPPKETCSEWARKNFVISTGAEKGPFVPHSFQVEPLDCISDPRVTDVIIMACTQVLKTTVALVGIAYCIAKDPDPIMAVFPHDKDVNKFSKFRLDPMIRDVPQLRDKVSESKSRDSKNTLDLKDFPGGPLILVSATQPGNLASFTIRYLFCDEIDKFDLSAGKEGDPISLARKRQAQFRGRRKTILTCSPTIKDRSRIAIAYEDSDQRKYFVSCPYCRKKQLLTWGKQELVGGVKWDQTLPVHEQPESAYYECLHCQKHWNDPQRWKAVEKGQWVATKPFAGKAGFHLNEIYSPYKTLADIVKDFLAAKDNPEFLKTFINTSLAELWSDPAEVRANADSLIARSESYGPEIPRQVGVLTAGVDIQGNRIEAELVGWGVGEESWSIEHRVFLGDTTRLISSDPDRPSPWEQLDNWLKGEWLSECDVPLRISAMCVDGGHQLAIVARWCGDRFTRRVWATIGRSGHRPVWPKKPGRTKANRQPVFVLGVDTAKEIVYGRLSLLEPGAGFMHFPREYTASYYEQLTAEERVPDYTGPIPKFHWRKKSAGSRNEILDCRNNAYGALCGLLASGLKLDREVSAINRMAEGKFISSRDPGSLPVTTEPQKRPASAPVIRPPYQQRRARPQIRLGGF